MVLALALWQTVSDTFANKAASGGNVVSENTIAVHEQTDAYIAMPQLPYLPDAELAGRGGQLHSLTYSRIQRISTTEYIFSLKDWIDKLAQRAAVFLCIVRNSMMPLPIIVASRCANITFSH